MAFNPMLPLAVQSPDIVGQMARGAQAGSAINDANYTRDYRNALAQYGADARTGDQNALNALAGFDPAAAQGLQMNMLNMQMAEQQMGNQQANIETARIEAQARAAEAAARLSEADRAQATAELQTAANALATAQNAQQFDQYATELGLTDFVGRFEDRGFLIAQMGGTIEGLSGALEPDYQWVNGVGVLNMNQPNPDFMAGAYQPPQDAAAPTGRLITGAEILSNFPNAGVAPDMLFNQKPDGTVEPVRLPEAPGEPQNYQITGVDLLARMGATPEQATNIDPNAVYNVRDGQVSLVEGLGGSELPAAVQTLEYRAQAAGLVPGSPEYAQFMLDNGQRADGMEIITNPQGGFTFRQGSSVERPAETSPSSPQYMISTIDGILSDPDLIQGVGWRGRVNEFLGPLAPDAARVQSRQSQLEGQAFLQAFESLKGGGQITEIEGQKATEAMGRLSRTQDLEDYREALMELREILVLASSRPPGWAFNQEGQTAQQAGTPPPGFDITLDEWAAMTEEERNLFR